MSASYYLILACDGGGIRGLTTALLIQDLVNDDSPARDLLERVDLFAGTSTGGILSLGLASGLPIDEIVNMYMNDGSRIFKPLDPPTWEKVLAVITEVWDIISPPSLEASDEEGVAVPSWPDFYSWFKTGFERALFSKYGNASLTELLHEKFGDTTLSQISKVMVTTLQLSDGQIWRPQVLTNLSSDTNLTPVVDAALCTGAAPTYFPPYELKCPRYGYCTDGGLFANNPATLALVTAQNYKVPLDSIQLISLGTGLNRSRMEIPFKPEYCGLLMWMYWGARGSTPATPAITAMMDGVSQSDAEEARMILGTQRYVRGNVPLSKTIELDSYSDEDIKAMVSSTKAYIATQEWRQIKRQIANWLR